MNFDEAVGFFRTHDNYLLCSHESPDADGLGAQYSLCRALRSLGKTAEAVNADQYTAKYGFIDATHIIKTIEDLDLGWLERSACTIILIDTADINYAGAIAKLAHEFRLPVFVLDHHELDVARQLPGYVVQEASSCCELCFDLIQGLGVDLDYDMAQALFSGIVFDTGSFAYAKTSAKTLEVASRLLDRGVRADEVHQALYQSASINVLLLKKNVLATLELYNDNSIAIQTMTKDIMEASGAAFTDAEDLINLPLQSKSVEVSILFKESDNGSLRCSLRAKGRINVASIAQTFGGGGHKNAAGFKSPWPLEDIKNKMLSLLIEEAR